MLLKLSQTPTALEADCFLKTLTSDDAVLLSDSALQLAYQANPYPARGYVLQSDAKSIGGTLNKSWTVVEDHEWVTLLTSQDKQISW